MSFTEFLIAVHVTAQGSQVEKLKWTFKLYDVNGDGLLTMDEVRQVFQTTTDLLDCNNNYKTSPQDKATEVFNKMYLNGSGALTEDQFKENCLQNALIGDSLQQE